MYETATKLSWICTSENGHLLATELGKVANQGADRASKLRAQLASVIEIGRPAWAGLLPKGRKEAKAGFPEEVLQCFEEALLFEDPTNEIVDWWDRLSMVVREISQFKLLSTGREGEKLTIQYEELRTEKPPKWQSVETAYAGYDVLSIRSRGDEGILKIEVKCSDRPFKNAQIHVTEHEWITAKQSPESYLFHIWLLNPQPMLFVVTQQEVAKHIPQNQGKGTWRNACMPIGALSHPSKGITVSNAPNVSNFLTGR